MTSCFAISILTEIKKNKLLYYCWRTKVSIAIHLKKQNWIFFTRIRCLQYLLSMAALLVSFRNRNFFSFSLRLSSTSHTTRELDWKQVARIHLSNKALELWPNQKEAKRAPYVDELNFHNKFDHSDMLRAGSVILHERESSFLFEHERRMVDFCAGTKVKIIYLRFSILMGKISWSSAKLSCISKL